MDLILVLPWFPIIIAVGVSGGLLGRTRGMAVGFCCALFWIVLVQSFAGTMIWSDLWTAVALVIGAIAIVAMGAWAGESGLSSIHRSRQDREYNTTKNDHYMANESSMLQKVSMVLDTFDDWLEEHRGDSNPWPAFGEFIRNSLYQCCKATHVKPYRIVSNGRELWPLREEPDPFTEIEPISARRGIVGQVISTGRPYLHNDIEQNERMDDLSNDTNQSIAWCFAVTQGTRKLGSVVVGQLDIDPHQNTILLRAVEQMIRHCWCMLAETLISRSATEDDPISGVYTRKAFLRIAEQSIQDSYQLGEPVAIAVFSVEGLRSLDDSGQWELADQLINEISLLLKRKVRIDDKLGRFNNSQFMLLIRRVDSELATLIVNQLITRLTELCDDIDRWNVHVGVRCAVVGSGTDHPDLKALITRALEQSCKLREESMLVTADLKLHAPLSNEIHS